MPYLSQERFSFVSNALPVDSFGVAEFRGAEGLSQCYEFELTLVSDKSDLDADKVLASSACFTIQREDGDPVRFNGIVTDFEQMQMVAGHTFYRAFLAPKLWWLTQTRHNQVFLNKTVPQMIIDVLEDGGLTSLDYEFRLRGDYSRVFEFICMYQESHFNFFSRRLEREGMYFFFEQGEQREKIIITDTRDAHTAMPQGRSYFYDPPSGLGGLHRNEVVRSFISRQRRMPKSVLLKDYNYRRPSLALTGRAEVAANGAGSVYLYGEHFKTPEEGDELARIRAQQINCRQKIFVGETDISFMRPGYVFSLKDHYRDDFNTDYLALEVEHQGSQTAFLISGLKDELSVRDEKPHYSNTFSALPSDVQFRPEIKTEKPRIFGGINALVDASGSGEYAEIDDMGRYKVILPFDISGRKDGKASAWLRMAQPYAGADQGMHFPLHKGTEVVVMFMEGNPDRPFIASAMANAAQPNVIRSENANLSGVKTKTGSSLVFGKHEDGASFMVNASVSNLSLPDKAPSPPQDVSEDALISLKRGHSIGEAVVKADSINTVGGFASSEICGGIKNLHSLGSSGELVGAPIFQAINTLADNVVKKLPSLAVTAAKDAIDGGKLAYDLATEERERETSRQVSDYYDKKKAEIDSGGSKAQTSSDASRKSLNDRIDKIEEERKREKDKQAVDDEKSDKQKEWDRYYSAEKENVDKSVSYTQTGISFLSSVLTPVWELCFDLYIKNAIKNKLKEITQDKLAQPDVDVPKDRYECLNGDFAYSVLSDGSCVSTEMQSKWKGPKAMANPPKGMLFYEGVGSQVFWAGDHHIVEAKNNSTMKAMRIRLDSVLALYQAEVLKLFGSSIQQVSPESIQIQTTGDRTWHDHANKFPKKPQNAKGIAIIAYSDHDIEIKQDDKGGKKGKITLKSNELVSIEGEKAEIKMGTVDGSKCILIKYKESKISISEKEISISRGGKKVVVSAGDVSLYTSDGTALLSARGSKVTINGDLTITGKFTQPNQTND